MLMPVEKIIIGRDKADMEKYGEAGTAYMGKHVVGKGEEAHLTNPVHMDLVRPHILLICGKRGTGKCVVPETPVFLADGAVRTIKELFDQAEDEGRVSINTAMEKLVNLKKTIEVLSLDENLKVRKCAVSHAYRKKISEDCVSIRTATGREITATKEHPLLVFSGTAEWKPSETLKVGDYLSLPRRTLPCEGQSFAFSDVGFPSTRLKSEAKSKMLKRLSGGPALVAELADEAGSHAWQCAKPMAAEGLVDVHNSEARQSSAQLTDTGTELASSLTDEYRRLSPFSVPVKIPKMLDGDMAEFLAYLIAEGCEQRTHACRFMFTNSDEKALGRFKSLAEKLFGITPSPMAGGWYIDSGVIEAALGQIGYETCRKSAQKSIPRPLLTAGDDVARRFLRVYFDCEGYVSKRSPVIELSTASRDIALQISSMLLRFGVFPYIKCKEKYATNTEKKTRRPYYSVEISGSDNLRQFAKGIGFSMERKAATLARHGNRKGNPNMDVVPFAGALMRRARETLGMRACDCHRTKQVMKAYEDEKYNPTRGFLKAVATKMEARLQEVRGLYEALIRDGSVKSAEPLIERTSVRWKNIISELGLRYNGKEVLEAKGHHAQIVSIVKRDAGAIIKKASDDVALLNRLADSDVFWDKIIDVKKGHYDGWVYDLTVPRTHSFIAGFGGVVSHNSYTGAVIAEELAALPRDIRENLSIILIDTMGIYWSMRFKNTKEANLLKEWGLKPQTYDTMFFVPKIHRKFYDEVNVESRPFILSCGEITAEDWLLTFDFSPMEAHGIAIERAVKQVREKNRVYDIDDIIAAVQVDTKTEEKVKDAVINRFLIAKDWGVFEKEGTPVLDIFQPGRATVIDVSHYMRVSSGWGVRSMIVGLLARRIFQERLMARKKEEFETMGGERRKTVPMVWFVIDECHQFIPSEGATAASEPLLTLVKEGREPGISIAMITQMPNKLNQEALAQSDIIISHRLTARSDLEALRAIMQTYVLEDIQELINVLPRLKGAAIVLDDNSERLYAIQVRPRLSWHAGGSPSAIKEKSLFG